MTRAEFTALALAAQADPKPLIEHLCWITTKQLVGQQPLQRLIFNHAQQKVHEAVLRQRQAGLPPRIICLKSRQPGISTLACGYVTATALTHPYADSLIVTHLEKASVSLFKKITFMLEHLPMDLRPKLGSSRREELILDSMGCSDGQVQLRSGITVGTASGGELWRGRTVQTAHLSEFSAFPRPEETLLGVLQCVPLTPQSLVVIESTARGVGNAFHEEWNRAAAGESSFIPIFIGWWEIDEYRMAVPKDFEVTPEERELKMAFGLDNQQLQWRRYILHTQSGGSVDRFNQEYPSDPSVAFLVTGLPAFNLDVLRLMSNEAEQRKHELEQGEMNAEGQFFKMPRGRLKIYRRPEAGCEYTIGVDPASGIAEGDYCAIQVFNREREEQVAVWHGHMKPVPLSHIAAALGHWYNDAILAPELNGGHGFCLRGDTLIHTPSGDFPISELAGKQPWVYGIFDGHLVLSRAKEVWLSQGQVPCVRVTFKYQHGRRPMVEESIVCTPSHPIMLLNGEFKRAALLRPGERLMPFAQDQLWFKREGQARARVQVRREPRDWQSRARFVWEQVHGLIPDGHHVHHVDENTLNDDPSNLECLSRRDHLAGHAPLQYMKLSPEVKARRNRKIADSWRDPKVRANRLAGQRKAFSRRRKRKSGVENHIVVSVAEEPGLHDVYDMEVPGIHHFAANTIFVHNSMVEELKAVQYPRIYVWQRVDKVRHVVTNYFGWETSFRTRPLLIDSMAYAVAERAVGIRDQATIKELMEFQYHDGKKAEGLRYDDLAMAWMIAYRVHLEMPLAKTGIPPRVHYAEDTPKEAPADLLQGISRDAWEAVDKDIARMKTREAASDAMIDMPDPGDDDPALDFIPDLPW